MEIGNTKQILCKFLIGLFAIAILTCGVVYLDTDDDYISAKADVAKQKIHSLQTNIWNLNPSADTTELDKVNQKRYICIGGIVVSVIGIAVCGIVLYGSKNDYHKQYSNNAKSFSNTYSNFNSSGIQTKLQELKSMYDKNLITEDEYNKKKQELLNKM